MSNNDNNHRIGVYIQDILDACDKIVEYTKGYTFSQFKNDQKTIDAVIRNLEIVWESAKLIPSKTRMKYPSLNWRGMTGMRDKLIHEYSKVIIEIIWETVQIEIPKLIKNLR